MPHQLLFLHFGVQCPWQTWVVEQIHQASTYLGIDYQVVDISNQPELADQYRQFYPFMIVIDETIRIPSPIPAIELVHVITQGVERFLSRTSKAIARGRGRGSPSAYTS